MKLVIVALTVILLMLQYRLWVGDGSVADLVSLNEQIDEQREQNSQLSQRNQLLNAEVNALREGGDAIEARARKDLGMIKKDETFFMIVQSQNSSSH